MSGAERFIVRGRVQGVHFRAHAQQEARRLGLQGHAVNLRDGSVEVVAKGEAAALDALAAWLHQGSPAARVDAVERSRFEAAVPGGFRIG